MSTQKLKEGDAIYWRRKGDKSPAVSQSTVQAVVGAIIEVNDGIWTNYPTRLLAREIEIVQINDKPVVPEAP